MWRGHSIAPQLLHAEILKSAYELSVHYIRALAICKYGHLQLGCGVPEVALEMLKQDLPSSLWRQAQIPLELSQLLHWLERANRLHSPLRRRRRRGNMHDSVCSWLNLRT